MRVLGIDPGSRFLGYGVVERVPGQGREVVYVECGVISAEATRPMEERLAEISRWLRDVITEFRPVAVAVEDLFVHKNVRSALALAHARGMVLTTCGLMGLGVTSYTPTAIKKATSGQGRAPKDQLAKMIQMLLGLKHQPTPDAADALAIAYTHARLAPQLGTQNASPTPPSKEIAL